MSNYLELQAYFNCNGLLNKLTENGVLNYDQSKDIDLNDGRYITNVKYSDYRSAMLKYVSQNEFERNWKSYYSQDSNGNLMTGDGGGEIYEYTIKSITKTNDSTYSAKVVVEYDEAVEKSVTFVVTSYDDKCVIDSIKVI